MPLQSSHLLWRLCRSLCLRGLRRVRYLHRVRLSLSIRCLADFLWAVLFLIVQANLLVPPGLLLVASQTLPALSAIS